MTTNARESDMHPDLEWLARNVSKWGSHLGLGSIIKVNNELGSFADYVPTINVNPSGLYRQGKVMFRAYTLSQWQAARQKLGLDNTGIADPDEEECLQLAYERMGDESVKVSIDELQDNVNKPKHYQLRDGYEVYDLRQDLAAKAANGGATYDQYSDWDRAIEYIVRMWGKNRLEDAKKGRWYLDKLIGKLEDQG